jgi:membrane-bound lytic murein transglycosylase D
MPKEKTFLLLLISLVFVTGCSQTVIKPRVLNPPLNEKYSSQADTCSSKQKVDSTSAEEETSADQFQAAESYYAFGVSANQQGEWTKAQEYFEKALDVLSQLDIEEETDSLSARRFNRLLHEIAEDYKVTLLSLGVLSGETSVSAFWERFENIQNFKKLQEDFEKKGELDSTKVVGRLETSVYDMPIEWNERVENAITYLQTVARNVFEIYLGRSGKYLDLMRNILKEKKLPSDLVWLCLIESGFNPKAYSWARAMGPWQFIASTGRKYGLKRNWWYDERRDFIKSTYAACDYFTFLYNKFGSWSLALAGYNGGEGRVERAIQKHNTDNFWDLKLRKQTEDYVPLYMAATIIAKDPEKYGFNVKYEPPLQFDIVEINQPMDLRKIAKLVGTSLETMEELNPELLRGVTPPNYRGYKLRIPLGTKESFTQNLRENPSEVESRLFVEHTVRSGETLSHISQKYGVPLSAIMEANALTKKHILRIGQRLLIPSPNASVSRSSLSDSRGSKVANNQEGKPFIKHTVKKGETLSYLSKKYNISVSAIVQANDLANKNVLKIGQHLSIPTKLALTDAGKKSPVETTVYAAKKGDTVPDLALRPSVSSQRVDKLSSLDNLDLTRKDQRPKISISDQQINSRGSEGKWIIYIVKKGDTLWDIARKFGVLMEKLIRWNELDVPSRINVGDRIKILQTY